MNSSPSNTVLLFDWDGVIVDSNAWKWEGAWKEVFRDEPLLLEVARNILKEDVHKKLTRSDIVERIFTHSLARGYEPECDQQVYIQQYGSAVREGILKMGLISGAKEVLRDLNSFGYTMYVTSMSAQYDLEFLANSLGVGKIFSALFGTPGTKHQHVQTILNSHDVTSRYVVIGDGKIDREVADSFGFEFVGVQNEWNAWHNDESIKYKVESILQLPLVLDRLT